LNLQEKAGVAAEEIEALVATGVRRTSRSARLREWGRKHSGAVVKGLAGVVVALAAAWYGNQLADQYADRQEERQLEASLVTNIIHSAAERVADAQEVAEMRPGPRQYKRVAKLVHRAMQPHPKAEAVIAIYYGDDARARRWWNSLQFALYGYAELACCPDAADHQSALAAIQDYVNSYGATGPLSLRRSAKNIIEALVPESPRTLPERYGREKREYFYRALGLYLLQHLGTQIQTFEPRLD
jgi:hypothetical protein